MSHAQEVDAGKRGEYMVGIRMTSTRTHARLKAAAKEDNRTIEQEILFLLELRDHFAAVAHADHPLAQPLAVPV